MGILKKKMKRGNILGFRFFIELDLNSLWYLNTIQMCDE